MLLVTGYEPFADHETNPSERVAAALDGRTVAGEAVVGAGLPVAFDEVTARIAALLDSYDPSVVVSTGLAGGRPSVAVERVGVNLDDAVGTADNADRDPVEEPIIEDGPDAYRSTLPVRETVSACLDAGIPARASNSAGTHCCNHALYATRHLVERDGRDCRSGFVHLPFTPGQAARKAAEAAAERGGDVPPSLPVGLQVEAVELALERAV